MRVLITGVRGFAGSQLAVLAAAQPGVELFGMVRSADAVDRPTASRAEPVRIVEGDLTDASSLRAVIGSVRPSIVFHLGGASSGAEAWRTPIDCFEVNALGTLKLLEAIRLSGDAAVTCVVTSSGEVYGSTPSDDEPATEDSPLRPLSPYAASKAAQDLLAAQYTAAYGMSVIRLRLFNHTGPGQRPDFVMSAFARQIARIRRGLQPPVLEVGNLDARRDFLDVRDVARAYWLAAEGGEPGAVYNVCSGRAVSVRQLLDRLIDLSGCTVTVRPDPDRMRTADIPLLVGDPHRFQAATGWSPSIPLDETLASLLDWWMAQDEPV